MANNKNQTVKNKEINENNNKRKIMLIILLIIMILSLIASCSCTSNFFGKIGDLFRNEGKVDIDENPTDETVRNQDLKFTEDSLEISLSDTKAKLSFYYQNINPTDYTCTTSDAEIATCYVEDDYVVINPHKVGEVTVSLQTKTNGKTYEATAKVSIIPADRGIVLSSNSGTINLAYSSKLNVTYSLDGISGNVTVSSSDESIATAVAENGILKITAYKTGEVELTLNITYNGISYSSLYTLKVTNYKNTGSIGQATIDKDSTLISLTTNKGNLNFKPNVLSYELGVSWLTGSITLNATPKNGTLSYSYKRADKDTFEPVSSLKGLKLKSGNNVVLITVTAKDGSKSVYQVTINKATGNYIKDISSSDIVLEPSFNKNTLDYTVKTDKDKISLNVTPDNKDEMITYTYRSQTVDNLNDLVLLPGTNIIEVKATHDDETRTYTIKVIKTESGSEDNNSNLASLTDSLGKIEFNPNKYEYYIPVDYNTTNLTLSASAESDNATVTIQYNGKVYTGNNLNNITIDNLNTGKNYVTVLVKNGNNETSYEVVIDRSTTPGGEEGNNQLKNLTVGNGLKLDPSFSSGIYNYSVNVGSDNKVSFTAEVDSNSTVEYCYNDACDKDEWTTGTNISIDNLKSGTNRVVVRVVDKETNNKTSYNISVIRDSEPSKIAELKEIIVNGNPVSVSDALNGTASVTVDATGTITMNAIANYNGTISYDVPNIDEYLSNLKPGESTTVTITVTSEDGSQTNEYKVKVVRRDNGTDPGPGPVGTYTVSFTNVPKCTIGSAICQVEYKILDQDGNDVTTSYTGTITAQMDGTTINTSTKGVLQFKPNITYPSKQNLSLTISSGNTINTTIEFIKPSYELSVEADENSTKLINVPDGKASLILNTDIFDTKKIKNATSDSNGILNICAENQNDVCITVAVQPEYANLVKLSYDPHDKDDSRYLPISITVVESEVDKYDSIPSPVITVSGSVLGSTVTPSKNPNVTLDISRNYIVTISSGEGVFTRTSEGEEPDNIRTRTVRKGNKLDLTSIETPFVLASSTGSNVCPAVSKIFDYYETPNCKDESCRYTTEITVNGNITLTAKYREIKEGEDVELPPSTFWLTLSDDADSSLFYNPDNDKYKDQNDLLANGSGSKLIYPGASGSYTMSITNTLKNPITITGMILEEQTICVEAGCINMGYQINSGSGTNENTSTTITHFGDRTSSKDDGKYWILNSIDPSISTSSTLKTARSKNLQDSTGVNRVEMTFDKNTNVNTTLAPDDYFEITLLWKWIDYNDYGVHDALDTAIGIRAGEAGQKNTYELKVGVQYIEKCN